VGKHNGVREDSTFPRAKLQGSPIGQAYPREEGCNLAVICQRTEEGSPVVIRWGPEQILKYMSDEVIYNSLWGMRRVPYMNIRHTECSM
jgi:hypothetical protein